MTSRCEIEPKARSSRCSGRPAQASRRCSRALAGLVPHFHGGRFSGRGRGRRARHAADAAGRARRHSGDALPGSRGPGRLHAGRGRGRVRARERRHAACRRSAPRAAAALVAVGAGHLAGGAWPSSRAASCSASASRRCSRSSRGCCLLDEPTSQLDPDGAAAAIELARSSGAAVVVSEHRSDGCSRRAIASLFLEEGRLRAGRPSGRMASAGTTRRCRMGLPAGQAVCLLEGVSFAYDRPVLEAIDHRGGARRGRRSARAERLRKTTHRASSPPACSSHRRAASCARAARATSRQDPGRYLVSERADESRAGGRRGSRSERADACAVGSRWLRGQASARSLQRRAGTAGARGGARRRAGPAGARRADPRESIPSARTSSLRSLRAEASGRATLVATNDLVFAGAVADRVVSTVPEREGVLA